MFFVPFPMGLKYNTDELKKCLTWVRLLIVGLAGFGAGVVIPAFDRLYFHWGISSDLAFLMFFVPFILFLWSFAMMLHHWNNSFIAEV